MLESKDDEIKSSENIDPIAKSSKTKNKKNSNTKESVKKPLVNEKLAGPTDIDNVSNQKDEIVVEESIKSAKAIKGDSDSKEEIVNTQDTSGIDFKENKLEDVAKEDVAKEDLEKEKPAPDEVIIAYDKLSLEELADSLEKLLETQKVQHIKSTAEAIKSAFNIKFRSLLAEKKEAFLAEGGNTIDFQYSSPVKSRYNKLLSAYKKDRDAYYSDLEKQLKENLDKRLQLIEELKSLIENADTKTMYKSFRNIQSTWRAIGPVPKTKYNDTWKIFHHHVERFYDLLHLSNDFRDLDFKNNLEEKLKLIQKAEDLAENEDVNAAFKELQKLHKRWKEDVGPVAREMRDEVWEKFSAATKIIHDKRHGHFRDMKSQYGAIIEAKMLVIDEILNFDSSQNKTHNDWQKSIKSIELLRKKYFDAGKLPYSKSETIWLNFKDATKQFNQEKNKFYKQEKKSQQHNLQEKLDLIKLAESLKDSEEWETTTNTFKKIQSDWKKVGHVPRKFSDDLWKKFKAACNHYFDRYHKQKNTLSDEDKEILDKKEAFFQSLKPEDYSTKATVTKLMKDWNQFGSSSRNSRSVDVKFNKFVDLILSKLSISKDEIVLLKFKNVINGYLAKNDIRKLNSEVIFIRKKIDEAVREIQQLENNLSFFSNASDDNPLVKNVHTNINNFKKSLSVWENKLSYLRTLDY